MPSVTDADDGKIQMQRAVAAQQQQPDAALGQYFYRSSVVYQRELESLFFKSWLYVGHVSQLPNRGDYFLSAIADESLILVRDGEDTIRGLINSCRHRGSRVCDTSAGNTRSFVCPYHGWAYGTDGTLRAARHMEAMPAFRKESHGLKQARVAVRYGLIFINFDTDAHDFGASLAQVDAQLSPYHLDRARIAHRETVMVDANWKLALGNYLECYHCEPAHRDYSRSHSFKDREHVAAPLNRALWERAARETGIPGIERAVYRIFREAPGFGSCVYTSRYALFDGYKTGSQNGQPLAPLMGEFKGYDGGAGDYQLGPLTYMLNYPDHCVLFRFVPFGIDRTELEVVWFVNGDAREGVDYSRDELTWLWRLTTLEDVRIIQLNSAGVRSHFFEPGPQHPEFEDTPRRFIDWYLRALAGDTAVVAPTARAHRISSRETSEPA